MATSTAAQRHSLRRFVALLAVLSLLFTACGSDFGAESATDVAADATSDSGSASGGDDAMEDDAMEEAMEDSEVFTSDADADIEAENGVGGPVSNGDQSVSQRTPADLGREIIFTATVSIGVDDVAASGAEATRIIQELDGFVFGQQTRGGAQPSTVLIFKVRPSDFAAALERLGGIGELRNQSITTDDVTERVVDLESRIQTTELGVERLRAAMEGTTNLEDFARLEEQLLRRESDLEVLKGTLRTLRDQIDLATITLTLEQDRVTNGIELAFSIYEGHDAGAACPGTGGNGFEPGDDITLCLEAINVGDQTLTNLNATDTVLEIDSIDDLTVVFGDPDELQPGQSVMLAYELTAERDVNMRLNLTAIPTDGTSAEAAGPAVRTQSSPSVRVDEDAADPGFGDGFGAAVSLLSALWTAATVAAGFAIPLLVLLPVLWLVWKGLSRARSARTDRIEAKRQANQPPPPVHAGAPTETNAEESE